MKNLLFLVCLFFVPVLFAQNADPDSLFSSARMLAGQDKYKEALVILNELCAEYPEDRDFSNYLARLHWWNDSPQKAKEILLKDQSAENLNKEELDLLIQIEQNLGERREALAHCDLGINRFPASKTYYIYQKAVLLEELDEDKEALEQLEQITKTDPEYQSADYLRTLILKKQKNSISAGYLLTTFDQKVFSKQQIAFVEYGRKFKSNTHLLRVNYADMFGQRAFQFETDAYIKIKSLNYIYANLGISEKKSIFPQVRAALEFYREQKNFSASLGARYLYFDQQNTPLLITGHVGYLSNKGWGVNYRPFVSFLGNHKTLASHLVYIRKAFVNKESYVQLDLQYGSLPYFYLTSDVLSRLKAYRAGINARFRIRYNWFVQPVFMYEYEEYVPKTYRNRYTFQLILSRRF